MMKHNILPDDGHCNALRSLLKNKKAQQGITTQNSIMIMLLAVKRSVRKEYQMDFIVVVALKDLGFELSRAYAKYEENTLR